MNKAITEKITKLKAKYKDNIEALEIIENAENDIKYLEEKEADQNYSGQTAAGKVEELDAHLKYWY